MQIRYTSLRLAALFVLLALIVISCEQKPEFTDADWGGYLGGPETNQYSKLKQIDRSNVSELKQAWIYHTGGGDTSNLSQIQCNPLIIKGILYGTTPDLRLFALDAADGNDLWTFTPPEKGGVNRGIAYWTDGYDHRLFYNAGHFVYAVNADNGKAETDFGVNGRVDLKDGFGRDVTNLFVGSNTPGIVYKNLLILGTTVSESTGGVPGDIRAYDVKTGAIVWTFHTIPRQGEFGYDTWPPDAWKTSGGANDWGGLSLDEKRGIVFVPTGSASFDFYGGDRIGQNLFADCLIAINAETGKRIWHFQTVHHDLWDRDLPTPPNVVTVTHDGKKVDAVAQITKSAYIFLFNRETGEPLFPINEDSVPPSRLNGEQAWPTQPIPTKPPQFSRAEMTEADITNRTPEAHAYVKAIWDQSLKGEAFIPPSEQGTILLPGFDGGGEWGGSAFDPETGNLIVAASNMPWIVQMIPYKPAKGELLASQGAAIFQTTCAVCHGRDLKGASHLTVPSLVNLKSRLSEDQVMQTIKHGKNAMPSFSQLTDGQVKAIAAFLLGSNEKATADTAASASLWPYPYTFGGYVRFKDQDGYPALTPPWGTLNAINLNTGEISWKVPLGSYPKLAQQGMTDTGSELYGGPAVTAGGIIFVGATVDEKFRAFDKDTGKLLWETQLPAGGYATPSVYAVDGKEYVVIACGGGKMGTKSGDSYAAFTLP